MYENMVSVQISITMVMVCKVVLTIVVKLLPMLVPFDSGSRVPNGLAHELDRAVVFNSPVSW